MWHAREGEGYWNPEKGNITPPDGWVFVPAGDAFLTREIKKGPHWVLLKRRKGYTATLGVFCPEASLKHAQAKALETREVREARRPAAERSRARAEERYRTDLESAVMAFLAFAPEHAALAREIARGAVAQATPVGSGRVGRTRTLSLEERAELAARAYIRHKHTDYEGRLEKAHVNPFDEEDYQYREIKGDAHKDVDRFLARHRALRE